VLFNLGDLDTAATHFQRAIALIESATLLQSEVISIFRKGLAVVLFAQGNRKEAAVEIERALKILEQNENLMTAKEALKQSKNRPNLRLCGLYDEMLDLWRRMLDDNSEPLTKVGIVSAAELSNAAAASRCQVETFAPGQSCYF
jgi:tetratricopeptide (TPR) repeat protein